MRFIAIIFICVFSLNSNAQKWSLHTSYKDEWTAIGINGKDTVRDTVGYTIVNYPSGVSPIKYGPVAMTGSVIFTQDDGSSYRLIYTDYELFDDKICYYTQGRVGRITYYKKEKIITRDWPNEWFITYR